MTEKRGWFEISDSLCSIPETAENIHLFMKELLNTVLIAKLLLFRANQEHSKKCNKTVTAENRFGSDREGAADMTMVSVWLMKYSVLVNIYMHFKVKS